ncbi:hypothetical protein WA158_002758 [Blastocystis sp. Blastoise]
MHVRNSSINSYRFETIVETINNGKRLSLIDDIDVRWNSTFYMLQRYLRLYSAVISYSVQFDVHEYDLCENEITLVQDILSVLALFESITNKLSGSLYPTLPQVLPYFLKLYDTLNEFYENTKVDTFKTGLLKAKDMLMKSSA